VRQIGKALADTLGFEYPSFEGDPHPVDIDEFRGATILGLYMDQDPQPENDESYNGPMQFRVVLVLEGGKALILTEGGQAGYMKAEFVSVK
jgi:hypothetical protein